MYGYSRLRSLALCVDCGDCRFCTAPWLYVVLRSWLSLQRCALAELWESIQVLGCDRLHICRAISVCSAVNCYDTVSVCCLGDLYMSGLPADNTLRDSGYPLQLLGHTVCCSHGSWELNTCAFETVGLQ